MFATRVVRKTTPNVLKRCIFTKIMGNGMMHSFNRVAITNQSLVSMRSFSMKTLVANSKRAYSVLTEDPDAVIYDYSKIKDVVSHPEKHPETIIVDVREPSEFQEGHIPNAINIPFSSSPGALSLAPEEFSDTFGFDKPSIDKELVFYCLAGVRSTAAQDLARTFGYKNRGNYIGSYEDWVSHENSAASK